MLKRSHRPRRMTPCQRHAPLQIVELGQPEVRHSGDNMLWPVDGIENRQRPLMSLTGNRKIPGRSIRTGHIVEKGCDMRTV